jgi:hypothetical protein
VLLKSIDLAGCAYALGQIVKVTQHDGDDQAMLACDPSGFNASHCFEFPGAVAVFRTKVSWRKNHYHADAFAEAASEGGIVEITSLQALSVEIYFQIRERFEFTCQSFVQLLDEPPHEIVLAVAITMKQAF